MTWKSMGQTVRVTLLFKNLSPSQHRNTGPLTVAYPLTLSGFEAPFQQVVRGLFQSTITDSVRKVLKSLGIDRVDEPVRGP